SATFTVVALELVQRELANERQLSLDPTRLVEAVTAGVAFLAAGTIIQARGKVQGLTTGAGLLLAGAIGTACGLGVLSIAMVATALGFIVSTALRFVARAIPRKDIDEGDMRGD